MASIDQTNAKLILRQKLLNIKTQMHKPKPHHQTHHTNTKPQTPQPTRTKPHLRSQVEPNHQSPSYINPFAPWRKAIINKLPNIANLNQTTKFTHFQQKKAEGANQQQKKQCGISSKAKEENQTKAFFQYYTTYVEKKKKKKAGQLVDLKACGLTEIVDYCFAQKAIAQQDYYSYLFHKGPYIEKSYLQKFVNNKLQQFNYNKTRFTLLDHRRLSYLLNKLAPDKYALGENLFTNHTDITNFFRQIYQLPWDDYCHMCAKLDEKYNLTWWKIIIKKHQLYSPNLANIQKNTQPYANQSGDQKLCQLLPSFHLSQALQKQDPIINALNYPNQQLSNLKNKHPRIVQQDESGSYQQLNKNLNISQKILDLNLSNEQNKIVKNQYPIFQNTKTNKLPQRAKKSFNNKKPIKKNNKRLADDDDGEVDDYKEQSQKGSFSMSKSDFSLGQLGESSQDQNNIFDDSSHGQEQDLVKKQINSPKVRQKLIASKKDNKEKNKGNNKKIRPKDDDFFSSLDSDQFGGQFDEDDIDFGSQDRRLSLSLEDDSFQSQKPKKNNKNLKKIEIKKQKIQRKHSNDKSNKMNDQIQKKNVKKTKKVKAK